MGFLSKYAATERIDLEDGFYVEIKKFLTSAEHGEAERALLMPKMDTSGGEPTMTSSFDHVAFAQELAVQAICAWNLTDEVDQLLPLAPIEARREAVKRLPNFVVDKVAKAVQANEKRGEEEHKSVAGQHPDGAAQ
ncbi:hypothetical protein [Streptomyces sp. NPDC093261]|uniref:hypothetical protein n=1 Tax=Streptomyces sp. NPDC093261 TaxID=3366037 RepID=UPI00381005A4